MNCPICKKQMKEQDFGGVKVDVCVDGCKGIWFDWQELRKLDEKNEGLGLALQEALRYPRVNDNNRGQITCPKCGRPMHQHLYERDKEINVDECYNCAGFFLDSGELRHIRDNHMSAAEEKTYADKLMAADPVFQHALADEVKGTLRTDAVKRFTRFLRLSYYITGK